MADQTECECVTCHECKGSGSVWFSFGGRYLGDKRCDDLDSLESCETCGSSGTIQTCAKCQIELDEEDDYNA